jgi:hypothetical protein
MELWLNRRNSSGRTTYKNKFSSRQQAATFIGRAEGRKLSWERDVSASAARRKNVFQARDTNLVGTRAAAPLLIEVMKSNLFSLLHRALIHRR